MEYFRDMPTESWTCNKVCAYYKNDPRHKDKDLREILSEIKNDLKVFNEEKIYDPSLHKKATEILNNWKVCGFTCYVPSLSGQTTEIILLFASDRSLKIAVVLYTRNIKRVDKRAKIRAKQDKFAKKLAKLGNDQVKLSNDQAKKDQQNSTDDISTYVDIEKIVNLISNCTDNLNSPINFNDRKFLKLEFKAVCLIDGLELIKI
ncbi:16886_t:CDS:2 [Funneliformis geosporum]|uniref:16886_t:CDS:1 n=1 Tax=Funneliformis geosporum TaxID=1117311 RepID=A0A9W4SAM1_9GLOM|nr:16886_t:CDS:2 [Funneliformis geosporum]